MNPDLHMPVIRWILFSLLCLAATPAAHSLTNPTPQRAYVSLHGSDANNCGPTAPCRTLQAALAQVDPNGEVLVLDSGAYGTMIINQGVTVIAPPGVYAGISVFSGDGIAINTTGSVALVGLSINGLGGTSGIRAYSVDALQIKNCVISNMTGSGIQIGRAVSLHVSDTELRHNAGDGISVVYTNDLTLTLDRVHIQNGGGNGVNVAGPKYIHMKESIITEMAGDGIHAAADWAANSGKYTSVVVNDTQVSNNSGSGVHLEGTGVSAVLDGVRADHNGSYGVHVLSGPTAAIRNSTGTGNVAAEYMVDAATANTSVQFLNAAALGASNAPGIVAQAASGRTCNVAVEGSTVRNHFIGITIDGVGTTTLLLSGSHISEVTYGIMNWNRAGSVVTTISRGDNTILASWLDYNTAVTTLGGK